MAGIEEEVLLAAALRREGRREAMDHTGEAWDVWHDGGDIYHIDATMGDGEKVMVAGCIEGEGRARVMAAAPDLLAAIEDVPLPVSGQHPAEWSGRFWEWIERVVRPTIAKAKGG